MPNLVLLRVGVPQGTSAETVWRTLQAQPDLQLVTGARLYRPTRGFFEPTEWLFAGDTEADSRSVDLPGETLPLRKLEIYPFQGEINPYNRQLLGSGMPIQLVTITVVEPYVQRFEDWYGEHADVLSRAVGATGVRRYWLDGTPRRYASLYYYESDEGFDRYFASDVRAAASQSRLPFDPWLVDQHHAYYQDVTPE